MVVKKRHIVAALAATVALATTACGGSDSSRAAAADGQSRLVKVMMTPAVAYRLPVMVAEEKGFFDELNIQIEDIPQPNNMTGAQGIASTKSDAGQLSVATAVQAIQAGQDLKMFCGLVMEVQSSLMANVDSDYPSTTGGASWQEVMKSAQGKRVGVQAPVGSGFQLLTAAAFEEAGVTDITWVNMGAGNASNGAALDSGSVDFAIASPPATQFLEDSGKQEALEYLPDGPSTFKDYYGSAWAAPTSWVESNADTAKDFCAGVQKGIDYVQDPANADDVKQILMQDTKIPENIAQSVLETVYKPYSTALPADRFRATLEGYVDAGIAKASPPVTYESLVTDLSAPSGQ
ncbi:ABC transporter substrate-binding protein [Gordonia terrae]|uniref:ABC transporter substrate-binding protein n=2 Tax=Gordonia terrae TaxID=2055 RepID=A0AAD0K3W4_9ACTN|nr:ABC transporter substrate-binding protein [Gordonia terrae]VTR09146.1 NLPA lipoprotein [Clostridioides difficile]ANY21831.1 hypothetical protein BCM27_02520 [Gordonia terrae]AWO82563.1 ABC transporter substrate-binding protein [Gordonia terrae]VTS21864.1 ABC-type taurine transport system, periplasmic component [Gordonia terrae]GAB44768.1 hypothetical protein GOTRE_071_00950 [Gordonia terrae NBRC 100016]